MASSDAELVQRAKTLVTAALASGTTRETVAAALAELERALTKPSAPVAGLMACLTFDPAGGGKLIMTWSEGVAIDGALACFVPTKTVPKWKVTSNAGRSEIMNDVGNGGTSFAGGKKRFFEGWTYFAKEARAYEGTLTHLANLGEMPVTLYLNLYHTLDVVRLALGTPVDLGAARAVAAVGGSAAGSKLEGCSKLDHALFIQYGHKDGASFDFLPQKADPTKFRDPGPSPRKQGPTHSARGLPPLPAKGVAEEVESIGGTPDQALADAALADRQAAARGET